MSTASSTTIGSAALGTAVRTATASDVNVFVDEVLTERAAMAAGGTKPTTSPLHRKKLAR
jgi:hypothetical protein